MDFQLEHIAYAIVAIVIIYVLSGSSSEPKEEKKATHSTTKEVANAPKSTTNAAAEVTKKYPAAPKEVKSTTEVKKVATEPVVVKKVDTRDFEAELEKEEKAKKAKADKKKAAKKAKAAAAASKVVAAPVVEQEQEESDSENEDDVKSAVEKTGTKKQVNHDQEAVLGRSDSQDELFDNTLWEEVAKAPRTKKPPKVDKKVAAKQAVETKLPKEPASIPRFPQPSDGAEATTKVEKQEEVVVVPAAPVIESIVKTVQIENKRVGAVVGAKGATLKAIQEATECSIRILQEKDAAEEKQLVDVTITGTEEKKVSLCAKSVVEVSTKGYCMLLKGENFSEGSIMLQPLSLGEIVGKGGSTLRAIQDAYEVKINTPQGNIDRSSPLPVKVGVVGDKSAVKKAKECIKQLTQWHHSDATHPGSIHTEMEIEAAYHKFIIGSKGSEIHHIQKNFKVSVHIPNAQSVHEGVLVVGEPESVEKAVAYIQKVIEKALLAKEERDREREQKPTFAEQRESEKAAAEEAEIEPWMRSYIKVPSSNVLDLDSFPGL